MVSCRHWVNMHFSEDACKHSHEFEVKPGMLVLPKPPGWDATEREKTEYKAMKVVVNCTGKYGISGKWIGEMSCR